MPENQEAVGATCGQYDLGINDDDRSAHRM